MVDTSRRLRRAVSLVSTPRNRSTGASTVNPAGGASYRGLATVWRVDFGLAASGGESICALPLFTPLAGGASATSIGSADLFSPASRVRHRVAHCLRWSVDI